MAWGVRVWTTWVAHRKGLNADIPPSLELITNEELNHWLSQFVMEVRNQNGQPYIGATLYGICAALQRFIREKRAVLNQGEPLDIYKDPKVEYFRRTFDGILKNLHRNGIGATKKQAEVISPEMEGQFWAEGCLGDDELLRNLNWKTINIM